jgi:hypothetical protein
MFSERAAEDMERLNREVYSKETKSGHREEFFEDFGGLSKLEDLLRSDLNDGLSSGEERDGFVFRRASFGDNKMPQRKNRTLLSMIWEERIELYSR